MKFLRSIRVLRECGTRSVATSALSVGMERLRRPQAEASFAWRAEPAV